MSYSKSKAEHLMRMYCMIDVTLDSRLRKLTDSWPTMVIDDPLAAGTAIHEQIECISIEGLSKPETAGAPELYDCLKEDWDYVWAFINKTPDYASIESRIAALPNYQLKHYANVVRGVPDGF